jgi:hypothetical protein
MCKPPLMEKFAPGKGRFVALDQAEPRLKPLALDPQISSRQGLLGGVAMAHVRTYLCASLVTPVNSGHHSNYEPLLPWTPLRLLMFVFRPTTNRYFSSPYCVDDACTARLPERRSRNTSGLPVDICRQHLIKRIPHASHLILEQACGMLRSARNSLTSSVRDELCPMPSNDRLLKAYADGYKRIVAMAERKLLRSASESIRLDAADFSR